MSNNRRDPGFWLGAWWPVGVCTALIALSSTPWFSANATSGPFRWIWQSIFGPVSNPAWGFIHLCIRKTAHFIGYGVVGLAWLRAWRLTLPRMHFFSHLALAVLGTALVSSCDEFHQSFLPSRTGSPWDVMLDCSGAAFLGLIATCVLRLSQARRTPTSRHLPKENYLS